jgi:hypothetical protein
MSCSLVAGVFSINNNKKAADVGISHIGGNILPFLSTPS